MNPIRVLLAEDHTLVRAGLKALLQKLPEVEVVAEAGTGRQAIDLVQQHRPHIVLMDIGMKELNGLDATARLTKQFPQTKCIILSMHSAEGYVLEALRAGAVGYLLKDAATIELELALRAVARGETYLSPAISRHVIDTYRHGGAKGEAQAPVLSPRQREVLQLIAEGKSTKEIAFLLKRSVKTIETHRAHLMQRLGLFDVASLVKYAIRMGLVSAE
jgi:DNA-binding NarL/FixJ family response regulator